jgi:CRP/FNR family cyclic AMP-dependent transcriptional regulator
MTTTELKDVRVLEGLSAEALDRLGAVSAEVETAPGQVLARLDDPGSGAFVVLDGTVAVELRGGTIELGPGEIVGELALLVPGAGRVARVSAVTQVRCLAIPRDAFTDLVESEPAFALALLRELARRLVEARTAV